MIHAMNLFAIAASEDTEALDGPTLLTYIQGGGLIARAQIGGALERRVEKPILQRQMRHQLSRKLPAQPGDALGLPLLAHRPRERARGQGDFFMLVAQFAHIHVSPSLLPHGRRQCGQEV